MKVLYFTRAYTTHDYRFLSALSAAGHAAFFLCLEDDGFVYETRPLPPGVVAVSWAGGRRLVRSQQDQLSLVPDLIRVVAEVEPDVVHAGPVPSCGFMAATAGCRPLVVMSWGSDLLVEARRDQATGEAAAFALRAADAFVCDCDAVRVAANHFRGSEDAQVVQFPWGVDLEAYRPVESRDAVRRRLGIGPGFVVLSTRLWEPAYGIDTLLEGVRLARRTVPDLTLVMLGDGSMRPRVEEAIAAGDLRGAVLVPGQVSQSLLPEYFQASDLYASCSTSDGSSVSLLEAMASGLPVVVTDTPGNREWVGDETPGATFPVGDAEAFGSALVRVAELPAAARTEMGIRHRAVAVAGANWNANVRRLFETYDQLVVNDAGAKETT